MNKLFLLRHADASPKAQNQRDQDRQLTDTGRKQASDVAYEAKKNQLSFDVILTSPYLRAVQTAEIFAGVYGVPDKLVLEPSLAPGCSLEDIKQLVEQYAGCKTILFVGHEPDLGDIAAALLGLHGSRPLKKAELVEIGPDPVDGWGL